MEAAARRRLWPPVGLILGGLALSAGYLAIRAFAPAGGRWGMASGAMLLFAVALAIAGAVGLVFQLAMGRSYEWLVAWRYLRVQHKRSWTTLVVGIGLLVLAGATYAVSYFWGAPKLEVLGTGPTHIQRYIQTGALVVGAISHWVLFFGFLMLVFSLFTTISIFTVFLGLEALVAVLSMMGGFEYDLRQKILGTTAHVVITRPKAVFGDYHRVLQGAAEIPEVVAAAPFLESEVMMTSQTNLSGVLLRGIDPVLIRKVTDLPRFLKSEGGSGSLENLVHPERLARIPEARFRPLVTAPLGEPPDFAKDKKDKKGQRDRREPGETKAPKENKEDKKERDRDRPKAPGPKVGIIDDLGDLDDEPDDEPGVGQKVPPRPVFPGVIIGAELAKNLRLYVGDDVNMVAPLGGMSPAGPIPKSKPFRVAGIFYSGLYEYDNKFAFVTIPAAQRFLGLADEVTGIELKVGSLDAAGPAAERAERMLAGKGYQVKDWRQRNVNLFSALKLEKLVMFIVLTFIVLVASFSIVTNLNMVVLEKVREIAALKAMGAPNSALLKVFLYAGLYIGIIGMLVGVLAGIGICVFLGNVGLPLDPEIYYISELPVRMDPLEITIVALAGVTLSFLATVYPSLLAARLRPADGLRRHDA